MPIHAFVDESIRKDRYILCAALIPENRLGHARSVVKDYLLPGQRRWHFNHEPEQRRRRIIEAMARCSTVGVAVYEGRGPEISTRRACLEALVLDLVATDASRLVIESRAGQDHRDRHCIAEVLARKPTNLSYTHLPPHSDPALWWPDAVARSAQGADGNRSSLH
ncbi:hypothetical protein IU433_15930 [Nocardia puris]|uniref:hypothetical protein n=1 Tax=Nocardia puris TaxID=208602 RepID=UPI0018941E2B|nr:hypothetical protein [Nocardia puris]MBF6211825.1 hypothetical protein [Nocardia puris]MBF6365828.1 hypothetical protein [Nocardia puris]MBF6460529.1 hypothetical protein [Nocardia puris]